MRSTLLQAVQEILSSMDSDEVNNYDDTVESLQVTTILKAVFYDLATDLNLPEHEEMFNLTASGDPTKPVLMTLPNNCVHLDWIKYDNALSGNSDYRHVCYATRQDFLENQRGLVNQTESVGQMVVTSNAQSFNFMYRTDLFPTMYTTIDDTQLVFDAFMSDVDTTLTGAKTVAYGNLYPPFTLANAFTPQLDPAQFRLWISTAKTRAFNELKQQQNSESASFARRQKIISQKRRHRVPTEAEVFRVARFGRSSWGADYNIPQNLKNGK